MNYYVVDLGAHEVYGPFPSREEAVAYGINQPYAFHVLNEDHAHEDYEADSFRNVRA